MKIENTYRLYQRALRFGFSGTLVTGLHITIAYAIINVLLPVPWIANGIAFIISTMVSYLLNTIWSFSSQPDGTNFLRFYIVSGVGLCLAMGVSGLAQFCGMNYWNGICAVVLSGPPTTFLLHNFWTYRA